MTIIKQQTVITTNYLNRFSCIGRECEHIAYRGHISGSHVSHTYRTHIAHISHTYRTHIAHRGHASGSGL